MNEFAGLPVSIDFITERVRLRVGELSLGYGQGWIDERAVIALALAQYDNASDDCPMARIALLLDFERSRVRELIDMADAEGASRDEGDAQRVWLYLFLAWLYDHRLTIDAYAIIDEMFAEFEYPEAMEGFVTFMPLVGGEAAGVEAMDRRWKQFLNEEQKHFADRG